MGAALGLNKPTASRASYQEPRIPELASVMGILNSATFWSSAVLSLFWGSLVPPQKPVESRGCFCMSTGFSPMPGAQTATPGPVPLELWPMLGKSSLSPQTPWSYFADICLRTGLCSRRINRWYHGYVSKLCIECKYSYNTASKYWLGLVIGCCR